jgi:dihydroorotate dehydrogenase (fumarate)
MDLSTRYLGFSLPHPLMMGASPVVDNLDAVRRAEDAGAAAIVMHSLFEEQIAIDHEGSEPMSDAPYFRPSRHDFALGPDEYLEQVRRIKSAVKVPVIGSLNGVTNGGWLEYARLIDQAGADALELNVYRVSTDPEETAESGEQQTLDMVRSVKAAARIPVAVKLSPFYTALPNFVARLAAAGADGVVLFNRFCQPDIDVESLEVAHRLELSTSSELLLRLRWLAILSAQVRVSLAVSGGVHSAPDVVKAVMAGADGIQLVSEIFKHGFRRFGEIRELVARWLEAHGYHSLGQVHESMNLARCPNPNAYERANYVHVLNAASRACC